MPNNYTFVKVKALILFFLHLKATIYLGFKVVIIVAIDFILSVVDAFADSLGPQFAPKSLDQLKRYS